MRKKLISFSALIISLLLAVSVCGCSSRGGPDAGSGSAAGSSAQSGDETSEITTAEETSKEIEMTTVEETTSELHEGEVKRLRIATYNIKHAAEGEENIASVIKAMGADIVGVQEVDYLNTRSGSRDQPRIIAKAAGMPYYRFTRAIDYKGGEYGTLILSKYPIVSYETVSLESGSYEGRAAGHAVIDVDGVLIDFVNTHLSYEDDSLRATQLREVAALLYDSRRFVVTADFNSANFFEFGVIGAATMVNDYGREQVTFPSKSSSIDNILLSEGFEFTDSGTVIESFSDHRPLWADVILRP